MEFSDRARRLTRSRGFGGRQLRDAADAHLQWAHPDLGDRLTESYILGIDNQIDVQLDLINEAGSSEDFVGYIEFLGPDDYGQ